MPLSQGQTINNRYQIADLIGQGGFGAVYRAWDASLNQPCAIKENFDTSAEAQRQFQREAVMVASLRHPNLPRVTDHFFIPNQGQYLVMDFVDGHNLGDILAQRGSHLKEDEVIPWIEQVCDALTYLHSRNPPIIHRDIKPQNIIVTPEGRAMLVDFGISKVYDPSMSTTIGARAVTPGYSPPEQYGAGTTDGRTDVYALGATLYTLLTAQEPPESVQRMIGNIAVVEPRQLNVQLSPLVEGVILKAINVNSTQRFQSVSELRSALHGMPLQKTKKKKRIAPIWAAIALGMILLFVGGIAGVYTLQLRSGTVSSVIAVVTATSTSTEVVTRETRITTTPAPIDTPIDTPTNTPTNTPINTPINTPTRQPTRTPTQRPTRTPTQRPTNTPTRRPSGGSSCASSSSGLPLSFDSFGCWSIGDERNGTFTQSTEQSHGGSGSGKLSYDFSSAENDYVVFMQRNAISGEPTALKIWVYGDGSGHYLNAWIVDNEGQTWQVPFGTVSHTGWREMTGRIQVDQNWPWTHISGPDNEQVDYPVALRALVLDDANNAYQGEGDIYLDDLTAVTGN